MLLFYKIMFAGRVEDYEIAAFLTTQRSSVLPGLKCSVKPDTHMCGAARQQLITVRRITVWSMCCRWK